MSGFQRFDRPLGVTYPGEDAITARCLAAAGLGRVAGGADGLEVLGRVLAAVGLLDDVASTQDVESRGASHFGGIKGSLPIYGRYAPLQYPNWATKFFADALLAKRKALSGNIGREPGSLFAN